MEELTGAVLEHGASGFVYREPGGILTAAGLARWAEEVVPAVREAVAAADAEHPAGRAGR